MSHRDAPPLLHLLLHHTTTASQILRHTTSLCFSRFLTLLFPALLLLNFRLKIYLSTHTVSSLIDRHALFSDTHRTLFDPSPPKPLPNATFITLADFSPDYAPMKPGIFSFKPEFQENFTLVEDNAVELDVDPASSRSFLVEIIPFLYANLVVSFILSYGWVHGVVFIEVVDHLLGKNTSFLINFCYGVLIGVMRVSGISLIKWAVMDTLAMLVGLPLFWEVRDRFEFVKVFLRMQFMPFVDLVPWVTGHEWESGGFIVIWFLIDLAMRLIYVVDSWDAIMDRRRRVRELVRRRRNLLVGLLYPAFGIRCLEAIVCGCIGRWMLRGICGEVLAMVFQSLMEVYFMVAWLVFCIAARCRYDTARGRTFGRRELEGLLNVNM